MKAIVMNEYGGPEVLKYADFPDPAPGPGEVLIRVAAAGINPVDLMQRSGATKAYFPIEFPGVIGWDLSGTVLKLGSGVKDFAVGDKVLAWAFHTYAELCVVKTAILAKIPDGVDTVDAAALPLVTITGSQLISIASGIENGQTILVSGGVGSVARAAVCTAKDKGATVIAGVRKEQLEEARTLGVDQVVALDDETALKSLPSVDSQYCPWENRGTVAGQGKARWNVRICHRNPRQLQGLSFDPSRSICFEAGSEDTPLYG
jgi:NADPH:quinone reductase-like Zn-dependent oxidoreductase